MTKLYYTDPLKAEWMAREFGVRLFRDGVMRSELFVRDGSTGLHCQYGCRWEGISQVKYSEHVFVEKEGDIDEDGYRYSNEMNKSHWIRLEGGGAISTKHMSIISKRNNTAFFMPIKEKDNGEI
jgi:hypothetical protein